MLSEVPAATVGVAVVVLGAFVVVVGVVLAVLVVVPCVFVPSASTGRTLEVVVVLLAFAGGPAVTTAIDAAATTRTAVTAITPRWPWIALGKSPAPEDERDEQRPAHEESTRDVERDLALLGSQDGCQLDGECVHRART